MRSLAYILGIAALILGWGWFGAQQTKKLDYDCQVRVSSLCFVWEKSDIGKAKDQVKDLVDRAVN